MLARDVQLSPGFKTYLNDVYQSQTAGLGYRYRVSPGPIIHGNMRDPNGWSYTINEQKEIKGRIDHFYPGFGTYSYRGYFGANSTHPEPPPWDRSLVYNMALEKLNAKVRGTLDLGVALAESGSTFRMLKGVADLVRYAESYVRRPKWRDIANAYLQWKYGWQPLCSDIFGAADESIRVVINQLERVSARVTLPLPNSQKILWSGVHGIKNVPAIRRTIGRASCTIVLDLAIPQQSFQLNRWTSLNPISIGWELIPYSFVVDWVFDVGSYLRNLETALLYAAAFRSGYVSELFAADVVESLASPYTEPSGPNAGRKITEGVSEVRYRRFYRTKLTSYPFPRKPTFRVDLGSSQLFSAAALLTQIFTKGK